MSPVTNCCSRDNQSSLSSSCLDPVDFHAILFDLLLYKSTYVYHDGLIKSNLFSVQGRSIYCKASRGRLKQSVSAMFINVECNPVNVIISASNVIYHQAETLSFVRRCNSHYDNYHVKG